MIIAAIASLLFFGSFILFLQKKQNEYRFDSFEFHYYQMIKVSFSALIIVFMLAVLIAVLLKQ